MQSIISLEVLTSLAENGFSLDELVISTRNLFAEKGIPGLIELILHLLDENISIQLRHNKPPWNRPTCCADPDYVFLDRPNRQFRTSGGVLKINWRRLRCRCCGKTVIPLREFLGLEAYQSKTAELEKPVQSMMGCHETKDIPGKCAPGPGLVQKIQIGTRILPEKRCRISILARSPM